MQSSFIIVLGSAAGGGFPQWNCNSTPCQLARGGSLRALPRTQSSLAVTADGENFLLLNCSPDIRQQINQTEQLHPREGLRSSPIKAVLLTNGDVDHIAGLLTLRENEPFRIYASQQLQSILASNSIFNVLNPEHVKRDTFNLSSPFEVVDVYGRSIGLEAEPFAVPGKVALFMEDASQGKDFGTREGDTIGLHLRNLHNGSSFYYIPACADITDDLRHRLDGADLIFFDGTLFHDDEMITAGVGKKTGARMGHMHMGGEDGSLAVFRDIDVKRKIYIHINNTNPVLIEDSPERQLVESQGWEVSFDKQIIEL